MDDLETACPGCRARLPAVEAPAHPYMTCSPACWMRYGDLLAVQYESPHRMAFHQIVVDTYAVQHPDGDDPSAVQSVGIHMMTLCLFLERGTDPSLGTRLHRRMVDQPVLHQLKPPPSRGQLTMLAVPLDGDPEVARVAT
ncbi:MAG: DUF5946 family protein [Jatrophihabitans sp.]